MHRHTRSDAGDISSPRSSRAPSFSSDRPSVTGSVTFQMPSSVRPAPAYIAASVASQTVTDHHKQTIEPIYDSDNEESSTNLVNALFSEQALSLLNGFLDHLLFAFLSTAQSPSLTAIRPAITEVLKPRLAREAMATADEELQGLLAGEDDEEFPMDGKASNKWDVEKVWKRTRLRIMVYTRLGELEDEDEERYVQQERGLSMDESDDDEAGLVSWASAIFLTSVVEYVAEQTLLVSGQAAFARTAAKLKKAAQASPTGQDQPLERIIVEEFDVEKLALNSALGRLWRTWRKRVRTPIKALSPTSRVPRYMSSFTSLHRRRVSHDTFDEYENVPEMPEHKPTETEIAANIPLPIGDNDIAEIEVPGLARSFDEAEGSSTETPVEQPLRPSSFVMLAPATEFKRRLAKERPISMPPPERSALVVPPQSEADIDGDDEADAEVNEHELPFATAVERMSDDDSWIMDERQEGMSHTEDGDDDEENDADMVAFAASTGMGFGMGPGPVSQIKTSEFTTDEGDSAVTPTQRGFSGQPQVLSTKRMSIKASGPPGIVRTYSQRSSSSTPRDRTPAATPTLESTPLIHEDEESDDNMSGSSAVGIAHTSNIPVAAKPSPPLDMAPKDRPTGHTAQPALGGYVEVLPRNFTTASTAARMISSPEKKDIQSDSLPPVGSQRQTQVQQQEVQRREPARREISPPKNRTPVLAPLQEAERSVAKTQQAENVEKQAHDRHRGGPSRGSPSRDRPTRNNSLRGTPIKESPPRGSPSTSRSLQFRETPVAVPERSLKQASLEGSPRSRAGPYDTGSPEKATLKRLSSSSSTGRSVSTSILHSARDSDVSIGGRPRGLSGRMSQEDRERQFDTLVKGQETVKFTLTPQNVRDIDEPVGVKTKAEPSNKPTEPVQKDDPSRPTTATVTVYPRVSADKDSSFGSQHLPSRSASRKKKQVPTASPNRSANKAMLVKPLAREPRVQDESMRDFADFIRSTGPSGNEERPVQRFASLAGHKSANGSTSPLSGLARKLSTKQMAPSHSHSNSGVGEGLSARSRAHMEPRSPAGQRSGNDDLIDFIRQGPPNAPNGQHRIPRNVAPFRSTVDSDQFERMLDDNSNVESSTYGSQVSTASKQSNHTTNSRTGLLPAANVVQPAYSNAPQKLSGSLSSPEPHITRTRRRVKDPYAIDLTDDEDDDLLTALPKPQAKREESFMDFLNNMEPPSSNEPKPLVLDGAVVAAARARSGSNPSNSPAASLSSSGTATRNGASQRTGKPPSQPVPVTMPAGPPRRGPQVQARQSGPREARTVGERSATNDLADFLRNSGPPEPRAPPVPVKEEKRRFWRKRTTEA